jgi:uncharacterized protein (TIGR03437 family)
LKHRPNSVPALILMLFSGVGALQAQNQLSVNPNTIFLNGTIGGPAVQQTFAVSSSPLAVVPFTAALNTPTSWLTITPTSGTTPATVTLTANPAGLGPGVNSTTIVLSSSNANYITQLVVFTVNNANTPLSSTPGNLLFSYQPGAPLPAAATLNIASSLAPPPYTVTALNTPWLLLGQTGSSVTVAISPGSLTPGQSYIGAVQIAPSNGLPPLIVPVVLFYFGNSQIGVTPSSVTFNYQIGATNNIVQKTITLSPSGTTFSATATVPAGTPQWLTVNPTSGSGNLTVNVLPAGLPAGTYQGSVNITASGSTAVTVPVTLNVSAQPLIDLSTSSLSYTYQVGNPNPADQTVTLTSTTPGLAYTVAAASAGNWLSVNVSSALTGSPVTVSVNPTGLPAGTYTGTLSFNALGAANNPQTVTVTLTVTNNPTLSANPNPIIFNYEIGQSVPAAQTVSVTANGAPLSFSLTSTGVANGINWLLAGSPTASTTPASFTVGVNPVGLTPNTYTGQIQLTTPGGTTLTIPVTLNVSNVALLNLPASISFNSTVTSQPGQSGFPSQNVTVTSTGEPVTYSVTSSVSSPAGSNWLVVGAASGPASSTTPSTFLVAANPSGLAAGTYKGSLLVHASNGTPDVTIPVTYTVTSGNLTVSPATLNFTQTANGPAPAAQTVSINSSGVPLSFSALTSVSTTVNWLTVTPTSGATPGTVSVSVNSGSLTPGTYTGQVNITSPAAGNSPQTVTVNLTVGQAQNIALSTASLNFSAQAGAAAPATQTVAVTASTGTLPFTAAATVTSSSTSWLSVTPTSGTASQTPTNLTVSVNPQGLTAGTYTGSVVVTGQGASNGPQTVVVNLVVTAIPTPVTTSIQNAGSASIGAVAPGEIISIFGTNLGPTAAATTTVSAAGFFATTLSETQVLFDGVPAAMWYASATQINAIVPYEIAGRASTLMQVVYRGTPSSTINLQVAPSAPGIFVTSTGQAAAFNANGSINGSDNPAAKGTAVVLFATGEGATNPSGVTGKVIPADPTQLKKPVLPVSATIGGVQAEVQYAGSAPGLVSGAFQVNLLVPDNAPSGSAVPVVLTVGQASSQGRATLAIQ